MYTVMRRKKFLSVSGMYVYGKDFRYYMTTNECGITVMNNINISYLDGEGAEQMVRIEMPTGFNIYKQTEKCREFMDLLREKNILNKFRGEEKEDIKSSDDDVFAQIEKLASLKEKGLISGEEFNQKKTVLLEKL